MKIRTTIAGLALAGAVTLGGTGIASAQTDPSSPPFPNHPNVTCEQAVSRTAQAQAHLDRLKGKVADLKVRRDRLVAQGELDRAQHLNQVIEWAEGRIAEAQQKLVKVEQVVRDHCGATPDDATATAAS